jgi:hypothetical protein
MKVRLVCDPPDKCVGRVAEIRDESGKTAVAAELETFEGNASETDWFTVKVPDEPGDYTWSAVVSFPGETPSETTTQIHFTVRAHEMNLVIWDVPSAVVTGETFLVHVGMKCSSTCALAGHAFEVLDATGTIVASGRLREDAWPRTQALHFAQVELQAPEATGRQEWTIRVTESCDRLPHAAACATFGLVFVSPPECLLAVEAIDRETRQPITDARIVVHPYRTVADTQGRGQIRLPRGEYTLFVARRNYLPTRLPVAVTEDLRVTAELMLEPPHARE